jgi:hypothetical protein
MDYGITLLAQADAGHRFPLQCNSCLLLQLDSVQACVCNWKLAAVQCLFDNTATDADTNNATILTVGASAANTFAAACCCCSLLLFMVLFQWSLLLPSP